ncbi:MAG: hypothetical protein ACRCVU_04505 [Flavobacterium sp.]
MIKFRLLFIITLLFTVSASAQLIKEVLPLTNKEIQKEQWILQDKDKNIILQWTDTALEFTLANKGINQNQEKTVYAKIPIKQVEVNADEYTLQTGTTEFLPTFVQIQWSQDDLEFFRVLENGSVMISGAEDIITLKKGMDTKYKLYSSNLDRFYKFVSRFDWGLIALNRNSDKLPKMVVSFDFENRVMTGTIDNIPFVSQFDVSYNQSQFSFHSITFNAKHKGGKRVKRKDVKRVTDKYVKYFTSKLYHYDIAEQTLNFYQGDQLVLMFGFMPKQE